MQYPLLFTGGFLASTLFKSDTDEETCEFFFDAFNVCNGFLLGVSVKVICMDCVVGADKIRVMFL
jgi:hypothetical protein